MANFLTTTGPSQVAEQDAQADAAASANRRKTAAYNALAATYGPAAGDPEAQAQLQANQFNQDTQAARENMTFNNSAASNLTLDQEQRADNAKQGLAVLTAVRRGVEAGQDPAAALDTVSHYLPALGVDPAHVAPLAAQIKADPTVLDKIAQQLGPIAGTSKIKGNPIYSQDADGKYHIGYAQDDGSFQELKLPAGQSVSGSPNADAAASIKADKAAQSNAAIATDLKAEAVGPIITGQFPGSRITGLGRTPQGNASVGGVPNSAHLSDQAVDFVAPPGTKLTDVVAHLRAQGVPVTEAINEGAVNGQGPHFHIGWAPKPTAAQQTAASGSGSSLSPAALALAADRFNSTGTMPGVPAGAAGAPVRAAILNAAAQRAAAAGNDNAALLANQQLFKERGTMVNDLGKSTPTSAGGQVASINTFVNHADQYRTLVGALGSGNIQVINQAQLAFKKATGSAAPTNAAAVRAGLGDEFAKLVAGGVVSQASQQQFQHTIDTAQSPQQLAGAIDQLQNLAAGRAQGIRQKYTAAGATTEFDNTLTPRARQLMGLGHQAAASAAGGPAPAATAALRAKYGLN